MEKRQLISAISLSVAVFALWMVFESYYLKHHPTPPPTTPTTATDTTAAPASLPVATTQASATTQSTTAPAPGPSLLAGLHAVTPESPGQPPAVIGSAAWKDPTYAMQVAFTPDGAGIASVTLNEFPGPNNEKLKPADKKPYVFQTPLATHDERQVLATRTLMIDGKPVDLGRVPWARTAADANSATFTLDIDDQDGHVARVTKTYHLQTKQQASKGYELTVNQTVANLRPNRPIKVSGIINGPTPLPAEVEPANDHAVVAGYAEPGNNITIAQHMFTDFKPDNPSKDLTQNDGKHVAWVGQMSTYFSAIVLPGDYEKPQFSAHADALDATAETERNVALTLTTPEVQIEPGKDAAFDVTAYFGPKWRRILDDGQYKVWPRDYNAILVIRSGPCALCTFNPLIVALVNILRFFHAITRDWGLAIICLVLCVRTLLHPITKRSQVQMMKMGKLSPEVEKLKKKLADKPDELNREMMKLYKQQSGAILGCLPMFLQTPIWIALWAALQSTFELRQEPFLYGFTWIHDLAKPDMLVNITQLLGHPIPLLFGFQIRAINILPLMMAVVTYINMKYFTPMPPAATPEQQQQQNLQRKMSVIFPLMFYSFPSGLNLYYLTTTTLGIVESKIIRKHIKEQEEAELAGRVIVQTKATRGSRRRDDRADENEKPKTGITARLFDAMAKAQARAEEIRKESQKRDPKN